MKTQQFSISGMHCVSCASIIERGLKDLPGVKSVNVNFATEKGRVVFEDWPSLWKACEEHWKTPGGVPGFGDWSSMIDEFDPFRDGRAAERMGMYLRWIQEGLNLGLDRTTVLADAAERYGKIWGFDKVIEMTSGTLNKLREGAVV